MRVSTFSGIPMCPGTSDWHRSEVNSFAISGSAATHICTRYVVADWSQRCAALTTRGR